ncbi:MAG: SIS domain-containing protein [Verrucomicrobia bacterium]|nr:SIS domain-containing protein [Verrucomicrobiota bacterium]MCF7708304.1 SIS domain-containing protein [Verrucomicrobiota bacterium]
MRNWINNYLDEQKATLDLIRPEDMEGLIRVFAETFKNDKQVFVLGNGGSAANSSHFVTDFAKGASDAVGTRSRCLTLNDNISWLTALGNDYAYEDVFVRQLMNYARPGDVAMALSVSGNSPNVVKAMQWAADNGLVTIGLVGAKRGKLADIAEHVIEIKSDHYGRVEDAQMTVCHIICYAFMENPAWAK